MSVGIAICFLAGRYHATPWDHQVNEGVVEWPPSPWRILRALVSTYYRLPDPPSREDVSSLLSKLTEEKPSYVLPNYTTAHTRHYMPIRKEGKNTTTRVFDTFFVLEGGAGVKDLAKKTVQIVWPEVNLTEAEQRLLKQLCQQVSYLGRAESWAELSVLDVIPSKEERNAYPIADQADPEPNAQQSIVKVLTPLDEAGLAGFRSAIAVLPKPKRGKTQWKAPDDVLEALELDIADLHRQGWNGIPGSHWVPYIIKPQEKAQPATPKFPKPNVARYALASNVFPKLTDAVSVGDRFHRGLIRWSANLSEDGEPDPVFLGKDKQNNPLQGHQHAWYLPDDADGDGKIDHVLVYAEKGFSPNAIAALSSLRKVWNRDGLNLQTVLISLGQLSDYRTDTVGTNHLSPLVASSRVWESITPIVLQRHPKYDRRGNPKCRSDTGLQIDGPEDQVYRMLKQLGRDQLVEVELLDPREKLAGKYYCNQFQRHRYSGKGDKGSNRGYGFRIKFEEYQAGPLALGYASHYGLGLFRPVE